MIRPAGTGSRNGLPAPRPYVYRGTQTLADELPYECAAGCGRRMAKPGTTCQVCAPGNGQTPMCGTCQASPRSRRHRALCKGEWDETA